MTHDHPLGEQTNRMNQPYCSTAPDTRVEPTESFGVWDSAHRADFEQWVSHWQSWPGREVAAHPAYAQLFATEPSQRAMAAYWKSPAGCVLYVFVLRNVDVATGREAGREPYQDIASPYGYGGPFGWGDDPQNLPTQFWPRFEQWAAGQGVVSEFVRFSLFDDKLLTFPATVLPKLTNVVCRLGRSQEELWQSVKPKVRRNVKKARREKVAVQRDERGETTASFQRIYTSTMERRQADRSYYFSAEFFETLRESLAGQFAYFHAIHGGKTISSELVLISAENVYFFLGGTDSRYYALRPNDLLKYEIMSWANETGKKHYVLGGGYQEGDGVFQYKQSFAPDGLVSFCTGQRIHDPRAYDHLVSSQADAKSVADDTFFPRYRAA